MRKVKTIIINLFISIVLSFFSTHANAQVDSLRLTLDNVFAHVDKSQVPSGFLEEYGAQFVNLKTYNGALTDSNYVNSMSWHYIYASVYSAKIYGSNTLPTPDSDCTVFYNKGILNAGVNLLNVFDLSYAKPDAVIINLMALFETPQTWAHTNHIDFCHCIRNTIFTITTLPPELF